MMQFSFAPGERVQIGIKYYRLRRKLSDDTWQLEQEITGEYLKRSEEELLDLYGQKLLSFVNTAPVRELSNEVVERKIAKCFSDYPEHLQKIAKQRLQYIKAIEKAGEGNQIAAIATVAIKEGTISPKLNTVRRWLKTFINSGRNLCSLVPDFHKKGNGNSRYPQAVEDIALNEIRNVYMTEERKSLDATLSAIRHSIVLSNRALSEHEQLPIPGRTYLNNLVSQIDEYELMEARYGKKAAEIYFREALLSGERVKNPLQRVEIDHTTLDLIVIDETRLLPLGRPTLTIALDRCTRCVLGYYIGYERASYISIMKCLSHAIKPKGYVKQKYPDVMHVWPCWGIMDLLVADNGKEFHSNDMEAAASALLIDIRYCPRKKPWFKGAVERHFRTEGSGLIHTLPGTTFSNYIEKGDYQPELWGVITETDLNELMHKWICDVYHQTVNRSTLRAPASLWRDRITSSRQTLPESIEMLDINLSSTETRTLFHYGVELNNLTYNNRELSKLFRRKGRIPVELRWDRSDLGHIHVLDKEANVYIKVGCSWFEYANGLSLYAHKMIRADALAHYDKVDKQNLDAAKARIREKVQEMMGKKKLATRRNAALVNKSFKFPPQTPSHPPESVIPNTSSLQLDPTADDVYEPTEYMVSQPHDKDEQYG